jgi:hypothetical protein
MPILFSNNQTEHRKLIEKLFSDELAKLGIEEVIDRIDKAKKRQDNTRAICEAHGAFRSTFEEEGFKVEDLEAYTLIDIEKVRQSITDKEIEKDRIVRESENSKELSEEKAKSTRALVLREIKDKVQVITEGIREKNKEFEVKYQEDLDAHNSNCKLSQRFEDANLELRTWPLSQGEKNKILDILRVAVKCVKDISAPDIPDTIKIKDGIPHIIGTILGYEDLINDRTTLLAEYKAKQAEPLPVEEEKETNTDNIDDAIEQLKVRRESAENNNSLVNRFSYWNTWIEAKGMYEKEIDVLRKLYAKVNVGVEGMKIEPLTTKTGRIEIWIKYNGIYDDEFFHNKEKEFRFLFEYSAFQRSIIGLMLQSARLSLKPKALRMAFIDDISVTKSSVEMMHRICDEFDLKLWTTYAKDDYDLENIPEGEIVVEGGHIFFDKKVK